MKRRDGVFETRADNLGDSRRLIIGNVTKSDVIGAKTFLFWASANKLRPSLDFIESDVDHCQPEQYA